MKVFVRSTCYDLVDLRAELHEDLRDLGVEALFSGPERVRLRGLSHGFVKDKRVPPKEIDRATQHQGKFNADPERHTHEEV